MLRKTLAVLLILVAASLAEARQPAAIQQVKVTPNNILECFKKHTGTYCEARLNDHFNELSKLAGPKQWQIKQSSDYNKGQ